MRGCAVGRDETGLGVAELTAPEVVSRQVYRLYAQSPVVTDYYAFDSGWEDVAQCVLRWITQHDAADSSKRRSATA